MSDIFIQRGLQAPTQYFSRKDKGLC